MGTTQPNDDGQHSYDATTGIVSWLQNRLEKSVVLSLRLKVGSDGADVITLSLSGKSFHPCAAATGNARSPTIESLVRGTSSAATVDADRNRRLESTSSLGEVCSTSTTAPSRAGIERRAQPGETWCAPGTAANATREAVARCGRTSGPNIPVTSRAPAFSTDWSFSSSWPGRPACVVLPLSSLVISIDATSDSSTDQRLNDGYCECNVKQKNCSTQSWWRGSAWKHQNPYRCRHFERCGLV